MYITVLDLCVCSLCREGNRQEKTQKLSVQEVSAVSPPLVLKREEQGEEKERRTQELLLRIHTSKQRVSIAFLYLRL